jgi:hypothetical protein
MRRIHPAAVKVPALDHDALMLERYDVKVGSRGRGERRVFAALVQHLEANGFELHSVFDGDDETLVSDKKEAMELVFNLDEASVRFWVPALRLSKERAKWHGVLIVLGNSPEEIVSDWNYFADDRDGFNAAMDAFDSERYA